MTRRPWTPEELVHLLSQYPDTPTRALAERLGRPLASVYQKAQNLGLKKSQAYLDSPASGRLMPGDARGEAGRFMAGKRPWNKGKRYDAGGRSAETRFKKGERRGKANANYQPIGAERITKDGYRQRKVNDDLPMQRRWKMLHVIVWEDSHGQVPDGHAVTFKDGDRLNCVIDNLALVSRRELCRRNSIQRYPEELRELMRLKGRVTRQINKRGKHAEQD
jgi:hypothetical protein